MGFMPLNSTENMNDSVFGDVLDFLKENWEEHPYWLVFMIVLMWVIYPIAYFWGIYNAIKDVPLINEHLRPRRFRRRNQRRNDWNRRAVRR